MRRDPVVPIFVDRKTAAARLMISIETFDNWVRAGFLPKAHIDRGQIMRWHWPSLEEKLAGLHQAAAEPDPFMEGVERVFGGRAHQGRRDQRPPTDEPAEMARRYAAALEQWKIEMPKGPLSKRERHCLAQFVGAKAGDQVGFKNIRGISLGTAERLELRRFIQRREDLDRRDELGWILTSAGERAIEAVLAGKEPPRA